MLDAAAATFPDMTVISGDYLYRQGPCAGEIGDCVAINGPPTFSTADLDGTVANFLPGNWGDNWHGWWADFVYPALELLKVAPIIAARGNHESCNRGGHGFFVLFDPNEYPSDVVGGEYCPDYASPYTVKFDSEQFIVFDNNKEGSDDDQVPLVNEECPGEPLPGNETIVPASIPVEGVEDAIEKEAGYWEMVKEFAKDYDNNFLVTHRPVFAFMCSSVTGFEIQTADWIMQQSLQLDTLDRINAILSGHVHAFEYVEFQDNALPPQLVSGNGGTLLDANGFNNSAWPFIELRAGKDEMIVARVKNGLTHTDGFGFSIMKRLAAGNYQIDFYLETGDGNYTLEDMIPPAEIPAGPRVGEPSPLLTPAPTPATTTTEAPVETPATTAPTSRGTSWVGNGVYTIILHVILCTTHVLLYSD